MPYDALCHRRIGHILLSCSCLLLARAPPCQAVSVDGRAVGPSGGFRGRWIDLEPLGLGHAADFAAATAEDPSLYAFSSAPVGEDAAARYIEAALSDANACAYAIVRRADRRVVGSTRLFGLEYWADDYESPDACQVGYSWLSASARRTPINTEAKRVLLAHAFEVWSVRRVSICADVRNDMSRRAIERLGFQLDGVLRAERLGHDGTVRDTAWYSMLATEWPAARAAIDAKLLT